ncbi:hypothetical protein [Bradyrhizobium sp. HKCCYLRH1030]|uniref:hypothetical protein n=1 Tax=Bradyrhizobium sp. HKCCYLRH1030 TaxID=3420744 RepID=UPI003EBB233F
MLLESAAPSRHDPVSAPECLPATAISASIAHAALALIARQVVTEQRRHVDDPEFPPLALV